MLKKENRLNKHLFTDVLRGGVACFGQNLSIKTLKTKENKPRFAVSVSKKELKNAVDRNRARRRVQAILRKILAKANPKLDSIVFLKKGVLVLPYSKLEEEIIFLLKKSKTL